MEVDSNLYGVQLPDTITENICLVWLSKYTIMISDSCDKYLHLPDILLCFDRKVY